MILFLSDETRQARVDNILQILDSSSRLSQLNKIVQTDSSKKKSPA